MKNYDIQLGVCAMVLVCVPSCASMDESACISVSIAVFMFMCTHVCMSVCVILLLLNPTRLKTCLQDDGQHKDVCYSRRKEEKSEMD